MVTVELTPYKEGLLVGGIATIGVMSIFQGLEILIFEGLLIGWTTQNAIFSVVSGLVILAVILNIHWWFKSVNATMRLERSVENEQ